MCSQNNESKTISFKPSDTAADFMSVFTQLDKHTITDQHVDYKRLYYRAFSGINKIIEDYENPQDPTLCRLKKLACELEDMFINM